eukprot:g9301.t1
MATSTVGFVMLPTAPPAALAGRMRPARGGALLAHDVAAARISPPQSGAVGYGPARELGRGPWPRAYAVVLGSHGGATGRSGGRSPAETTAMMATPLPETPNAPPKDEQPALVYGESATRSFVKALAWRLTAGVVTLVSGLVFSGSLSTAMSIVGSDFVTKSGFMFAGERLWNKVKWGQDKSGDSTKRSLAKAVLWRVFAASNTLICGVFLAKDLSVASKIAGTDTLFKTN